MNNHTIEIDINKSSDTYSLRYSIINPAGDVTTKFTVNVPADDKIAETVISSARSAKHAGCRITVSNDSQSESPLWQPLQIGSLRAANRFAILPMECADGAVEGWPSDISVSRYRDYCRGGSGIVCIEATCLDRAVRSTPAQFMLDVYDAESRRSWEKFIRDLKKEFPETILIFQYQHPGETVNPVYANRMTVKPLEGFGGNLIDEAYIDRYIEHQVEVARFLYSIGCDGVDIKMCHGYLGTQILRPYNDRDWKYGGSWENRSRFAFELCEKIRKAVPDHRFLLGSRIGMFEELAGGQGKAGPYSEEIDLTENILLMKGMEERGCDFFGETLGNGALSWRNLCPDRSTAENVFKHLAMAGVMRDILKPSTPVIAAGMSVLGAGKAAYGSESSKQQISGLSAAVQSMGTQIGPHSGAAAMSGSDVFDPLNSGFIKNAEYCIANGIFDAAGMGRQAYADPYLPLKMKAGAEKTVNWCRTCGMCEKSLSAGERTLCHIYGV